VQLGSGLAELLSHDVLHQRVDILDALVEILEVHCALGSLHDFDDQVGNPVQRLA
jgi:hypothetical protein